jgi:hypothetical protein
LNYFHFPDKDPIVTVFPDKDMVVWGKKCVPQGRTFFFDSESYNFCDIRSFGEIYQGSDDIRKFFKYTDDEGSMAGLVEKGLKLKALLKNYPGVPLEQVVKHVIKKSDLISYYTHFSKLLDEIFTKQPKPNYKFMRDVRNFVEGIGQHTLNLDPSVQQQYRSNQVLYDMYRSATGRFICKKDSFNILGLAKDKRHLIRPNNRIFVMFDQMSADFRTFLFVLSNYNKRTLESTSDLYEDFEGDTRDEKKKTAFQLIYGIEENDFLVENETYKKIREYIIRENEHEVILQTPFFHRELEFSKEKEHLYHYFISYLIQSLTSDITVEAAMKVVDMLKNTESFVAFTVHDAIVIDFTFDDYYKFFHKIASVIEDTRVGRYFWKASIGYNFGEMIDADSFHRQ